MEAEQPPAKTTQPDAHLLVDRFEVDGTRVAIVTFDRPAQHNPLDKHTVAGLRELFERFDEPGGPHAVVLTGSGNTFSAGGDLKAYQSLYRDPAAFRTFMDDFDAVCTLIESSAMIVVAMINGTCVAGGLELALACDFVTIAESARIGDGHLRFAQLPGAGGSQRLVRALGVQRARQWLLTGRLFPAAVAVEVGLALFACPDEELRARTLELVAEVGALTPLGRERMKQLITIAENTPLEEGVKRESDLVYLYATQSYDATEGLNAFSERRPPRYLGR